MVINFAGFKFRDFTILQYPLSLEISESPNQVPKKFIFSWFQSWFNLFQRLQFQLRFSKSEFHCEEGALKNYSPEKSYKISRKTYTMKSLYINLTVLKLSKGCCDKCYPENSEIFFGRRYDLYLRFTNQSFNHTGFRLNSPKVVQDVRLLYVQ